MDIELKELSNIYLQTLKEEEDGAAGEGRPGVPSLLCEGEGVRTGHAKAKAKRAKQQQQGIAPPCEMSRDVWP